MVKGGNKLSFDRLLGIAEGKNTTVHFVGIGGVSMYSLARLTARLGARVTGSDREQSERVRELSHSGARISIGHSADNVRGASLVVYSHAVSSENPELLAAKNLGIPAVTRAEYMGALMIPYRKRIGVCGTHGKSTTVAILDKIFTLAGTLPTVLSGAPLSDGSLMREGADNLLIYEACEYKDSFLKFSPTVALATNLEYDHADYFESMDTLKNSFSRALGKASELALLNADDAELLSLGETLKNKAVTYGQDEGCDYRYRIIGFDEVGYRFTVERFGNTVGEFRLGIPGVFNVSNAVGAIACALEYGIDVETTVRATQEFRGISRRLELVGKRYGRAVYYDYAHHPTEIRASINTLKMLTHDALTVIFKPHTYSRTKSLWEDFRSALSLADFLIICDIYAARETPIEGVSSSRLAQEIGDSAVFLSDSDVVAYVDSHTRGAVAVMGAGELEHIKLELLGEKNKGFQKNT